MAILPIRKFPDPVLKEKCRPVEEVDDELKRLVKNMAETMYDAPGIGLAASQVGVLKRVIVIDVDEKLMTFINPEITWSSEEVEEAEEGCLSVGPEITVLVSRPAKIRFKGQDEKGKTVEIEAEGLLARAIQHEMDHINGVIILDRTTPEEKRRALKELAKGKLII